MMSHIDVVDKVEEVLVLRVNHKSIIVDILYHNEKFSRLAKKIIGKNIKNIRLEEKKCKQCEDHLKKVFVNLKKEVFQLHMGQRCYQVSYLPELKVKGQVETVLSIVQDITKKQNFKNELRASQFNLEKEIAGAQNAGKRQTLELEVKDLTEQLEEVNKVSTVREMRIKMAGKIAKLGYFEWDQINHSLYWSDQQYRNYGYTPNEVTPTLELFRRQTHPDDWDFVKKAIEELKGKSDLEFKFRVIKKDGSLGWLYSRINVITNEEGYCVTLFGITQDITEQKQADERIHRVEKELNFTNQLYSRSAYLNKLLVNDYPVEQITKALNEFGIETKIAHCCFVIQLVENVAPVAERLDDVISPPIMRKQAVLIYLAEKEWGLVWRFHDEIVILASISDHIAGSKLSQIGFANDIIVEIEKKFPCFYTKIGISGMSSIPVNLREIYEKAHRAVVVVAPIETSSTIHCDDIGLYEVAFQLLQDKNTCVMVQNTIGRLAEYDESRGSNLLITLESILEHGSLKTVAQKLFVHHNTVVWRKRRIEIFLDMTLDKMETKMLLLLYIKIWNLQKGI